MTTLDELNQRAEEEYQRYLGVRAELESKIEEARRRWIDCMSAVTDELERMRKERGEK